jgi:hypothetical protein
VSKRFRPKLDVWTEARINRYLKIFAWCGMNSFNAWIKPEFDTRRSQFRAALPVQGI